jgi:hypothetical protein
MSRFSTGPKTRGRHVDTRNAPPAGAVNTGSPRPFPPMTAASVSARNGGKGTARFSWRFGVDQTLPRSSTLMAGVGHQPRARTQCHRDAAVCLDAKFVN